MCFEHYMYNNIWALQNRRKGSKAVCTGGCFSSKPVLTLSYSLSCLQSETPNTQLHYSGMSQPHRPMLNKVFREP